MNEKALTVQETAELTGITRRTLHYYDEIDLLKPSIVTAAKYRLYTKEDLSRLQEILFFREVGFTLKEIKNMLNSPNYDRNKALRKQLEILETQRERIENLIGMLKNELDGISEYSFEAFSDVKILDLQAAFKEEMIERWGETESYKEFQSEFSRIDSKKQKEFFDDFLMKTQEIFEILALYEKEDPGSARVQDVVIQWKEYISSHFYNCDNQMLKYLAKLYVDDKRFSDFINRFGSNNLAGFFSEAINIYCLRQ